jgi:hypothetical protein
MFGVGFPVSEFASGFGGVCGLEDVARCAGRCHLPLTLSKPQKGAGIKGGHTKHKVFKIDYTAFLTV